MRHACLIVLSLTIAGPSAVMAQTANDRRAFEAQERLRTLPQTQRLNELDRQLTNMDLRRRTDQNLLELEQSRALARPSEPYPTTQLSTPAPPQTTAYDKARDAELEASNDRLRALMNGR